MTKVLILLLFFIGCKQPENESFEGCKVHCSQNGWTTPIYNSPNECDCTKEPLLVSTIAGCSLYRQVMRHHYDVYFSTCGKTTQTVPAGKGSRQVDVP